MYYFVSRNLFAKNKHIYKLFVSLKRKRDKNRKDFQRKRVLNEKISLKGADSLNLISCELKKDMHTEQSINLSLIW